LPDRSRPAHGYEPIAGGEIFHRQASEGAASAQLIAGKFGLPTCEELCAEREFRQRE
jgi:hypothetical protein